MSSSSSRYLLALVSVVLVAAAGGCSRRANTPERAYHRFVAAVKAQDGAALFESLDQQTRWSWITIQKAHREAYDIILSNYPEGADRERALRRFEAGATTTSGVELFQQEAAPAALRLLAPLAAGDARIEIVGDHAEAVLASGERLQLRPGTDKSWGFAGLAAEGEERKLRTLRDVDVVRSSGADYERAAARSAR